MTRRDKLYAAGIGAVILASAAVMWLAWTLPGPVPQSDEAEVEDESAGEGTIRGVVVDIAGEGVSGARVTAGDRQVSADGEGRFVFEGLAAGSWRLDASAEGLLSPGPKGVRGLEVELRQRNGRAESVDDVRLVLRRPGSISGRVVARGEGVDGVKLSGKWLYAEGLGGKLSPFVLADLGASGADGKFRLDGLAPGRLQLVARSPRGQEVPSAELDLADGAVLDGVIIDLEPTGKIAGRIASAEGSALVADVRVTANGLSRPLTARSDAEGKYRVEGVPAGRVEITVTAPGRRSRARSVRVPAGRIVQANFELPVASGIQGRVVDQDGKAVRRAAVIVRSRKGDKTVQTDHGGGFQLDPAGLDLSDATAYAVTPWHAPSPPVDVRGDRELVLRVTAGGHLSGVVVDRAGKPVGGAAVSIERFEGQGPDPFRTLRERPSVTRADGAFKLGPLRPGHYDLRADHHHHAAGFVRGLALNSGDRHDGVRIVVGGGAKVTGRVTNNEGGKPIAGAQVVLHEPGSSIPPRRATTNADGRYILTGLSAGTRTLRVQHRQYLTELSSGLSIPDEGEVIRDVTLRRRKPGERFSFQGIGATLGQSSKGIFIRNTMPGSPAEQFGLKHGDVIVGVDFQPTTNLGLSRVVEMIRGEAGKPVSLDIDRPGTGRMSIDVERGKVTVKSRRKPPGHP